MEVLAGLKEPIPVVSPTEDKGFVTSLPLADGIVAEYRIRSKERWLRGGKRERRRNSSARGPA